MMNSQNQFLKATEIFDADKLDYIVNHFSELKDQFRPSVFEDPTYDPLNIARKYLSRSRNGKIKVVYRQNRGIGRYCAVGSMSLQNLTREIRHTISDGFYVDIDMKNAHPVILSYLCKKEGYECNHLNAYIKDREKLLKDLKVDREKGKQIYLALTNGGNEDFNELKTKTQHIREYRDEMLKLHRNFAKLYPERFEECKKRRIANNKDYNHEAGFMNVLMCDMENKILMCMREFFGTPDNNVLCFDGIMLEAGKEYDIEGCQKHIKKTIGIKMKLCQKPFDNPLEIPDNIPKRKNDFSLDYYTDFRNLVKAKEAYPEWVEEWSDNSLKLIENNGKQYFITRNKRVVVFADKTKEIRDEWTPVSEEYIFKNLKVKCNVINPYYDYDFSKKYKAMKPKEKKELDMTKDEIKQKTQRYKYGTLGNTNTRHGEGYLTYLMEERAIESVNATDFYPFLQSKGSPELYDTFNIFTQFPLETLDIETDLKFEESKFFKHLKTDFFNDNKDELDHFLDHMADIIQDPAQIKGTSHLFYSKQGCGKGMLFKFMSRMLGIANVISIINTETYFDKNFNSDVSNKLLKVFEEVSEKGSAFKNHNRLKGEQTSEKERVEPKGIDPYYNRHCARFWYFTNNENSLYIENDDRRHTLHRIKDTHANNYEYFKPIWEEIKNEKFLKSAFEFLSTRTYEEKNVMNAYTTAYKKEQKDANLPKGIKFILKFVEGKFDKVEDKWLKITSDTLKQRYKNYCEGQGTKYQLSAFNTQIKKIGIEAPKQLRIKDSSGSSIKRFCYKINSWKLQEEMRRFLRDDDYILKVGTNQVVEDVDSDEVLDDNAYHSGRFLGGYESD